LASLYVFYDIFESCASFKKYLIENYRHGKYHALKIIAKKIPLPMSGEEG